MLIPLPGMDYFQQLLYSPRVLMPYSNYAPENKQKNQNLKPISFRVIDSRYMYDMVFTSSWAQSTCIRFYIFHFLTFIKYQDPNIDYVCKTTVIIYEKRKFHVCTK